MAFLLLLLNWDRFVVWFGGAAQAEGSVQLVVFVLNLVQDQLLHLAVIRVDFKLYVAVEEGLVVEEEAALLVVVVGGLAGVGLHPSQIVIIKMCFKIYTQALLILNNAPKVSSLLDPALRAQRQD